MGTFLTSFDKGESSLLTNLSQSTRVQRYWLGFYWYGSAIVPPWGGSENRSRAEVNSLLQGSP